MSAADMTPHLMSDAVLAMRLQNLKLHFFTSPIPTHEKENKQNRKLAFLCFHLRSVC